MYRNSLLAQAMNLYDAGAASKTLGSASTGHFFEKSDSMIFKLPKMSYLPINWQHNTDLTENILYQPRNSNLESGDTFCVIPDGK
eukprot:gene11055-14798_t